MSGPPDISQQASRPLPKPGQQLGRFAILRKLSQGDTGVVYLAEDVSLGGEVALKILSASLSESEAFQVLSREVLLTRRLSHPGICRVYDLHEDGAYRFLTMEAVRGPSLEEVLVREGTQGLPPPRAVELVLAVGEAVAAAHAGGVVHRGLRPAVIALRADGSPVVLDFGHARAPGVGGRTFVQRAASDLGYVAQELLAGRPADELSDLYSLGAILYRALTGRTPLEAVGPEDEGGEPGPARPERPSRLNHLVTRELEAAVLAAIAPAPQLRPKDVTTFLDMLRAALPELQVRGRRPRREASEPVLPSVRVRRVSLLFSDMVGVTAFFEKHGDLAGRERIAQHNALLFPVVRRGGGEVLKTIGDSIMAVFEDEDEAVECACRMQQALAQAPAGGEEPIRVRIGLHAGDAIVEVGDAFGDAVNVAARVCAKAGGGQILISEDTLKALTRNQGRVRFHQRVALKGKSEAFQLFEVDWAGGADAAEVPAEERKDTTPRGRALPGDTDRAGQPLPPPPPVGDPYGDQAGWPDEEGTAEEEAQAEEDAPDPASDVQARTVLDGRPLGGAEPGSTPPAGSGPDSTETQELDAVAPARAVAPPGATVLRGRPLDGQRTDRRGAAMPPGKRPSVRPGLVLVLVMAAVFALVVLWYLHSQPPGA